MTSLLHLDSSANRSGGSISRQLTALFADTWRTANSGARYRYRDLAADPVPPLDTAYCTLGRRVESRDPVPLADVAALAESPAERRAWALTRPLITELLSAGTVLIGAPMYNYSIAAALKAWIDRVTFPGAFTDHDTGAMLLRDTRFVVIAPRGGAKAPEFQTTYLRAYFGRHGVPDEHLCFVTAELTVAEIVPHLARFRQQAAASLAAALAEVTALATRAEFGRRVVQP